MKEKLPHRIPGAHPIPRGINWQPPTDIATLVRVGDALRRYPPQETGKAR
ncbi:hypothetical protein ABZV91_20095 [Nocardia sp. NPDC004568]